MERKLENSQPCDRVRTHTPRVLFVRTVTVLLCSAHDKDWDLIEEVQGWGVDDGAFIFTCGVTRRICSIIDP